MTVTTCASCTLRYKEKEDEPDEGCPRCGCINDEEMEGGDEE